MDPLQLFGILMGTGLVQKHVLSRLPNNLIPYIQMLLGGLGGHFTGMGASEGLMLGAASIGAHQAVKIPTKKITGKSV